MGRNKLKDVFSTEPPQPEIEVVFRDAEAQKEFEEAIALQDTILYVKTAKEWLDVQKHIGDEEYLKAKGYYNKNR